MTNEISDKTIEAVVEPMKRHITGTVDEYDTSLKEAAKAAIQAYEALRNDDCKKYKEFAMMVSIESDQAFIRAEAHELLKPNPQKKASR